MTVQCSSATLGGTQPTDPEGAVAVPSLANTWKCTVRQDLGDVHCETVFHVTAATLSDPADVAADVGAAWTASGSISSLQVDSLSYGDVSVQPYDGSSAPINVAVGSFTGTTGDISGDPVGVNVSAIFTLRTLVSGKSHRGRMYLPGFLGSALDPFGARWESPLLTDGQTAADDFKAALEAGTAITALVVYSRLHNTKTNVSSMVFRHYLGSQRRRSEQAIM